jgi:hemerythrin superfamily protein
MATDAVTLIMNDHRLMEQLFERLKSDDGDRRALLAETAARLAAHSHAEEQKVYPALAKAAPGELGDVEHAVEEHHDADVLLHRLQGMEPADPAFNMVLEKFVKAVLKHVQEEESQLLPALQEAVDPQTLEALGAAFEEVRAHELEVAGMGRAATGGSDPAPNRQAQERNPDDMSRDELYAQAKEAGIAGRSNMTKAELARALRDQG